MLQYFQQEKISFSSHVPVQLARELSPFGHVSWRTYPFGHAREAISAASADATCSVRLGERPESRALYDPFGYTAFPTKESGRVPPQQGSPTVRRLRLGQELRLLRERRNLTGAKAARELGWSASKISRIEAAKTMPSGDDVKAMAELYGVDTDKLDELFAFLRDAERRGWWEDYGDSLPAEYTRFLGLEAEATAQRNWEPQVVPGLLQTEDYAREVILATRGIARITHSGVRSRVEARLDRQKRVLHRPDPCELRVVLDEAALMRRFGEPSVMRAQMEHLLEMSQLPQVSVRVLTLEALHPVNTSAFIHLKFTAFDDVVYLEQLYTAHFVEDLERVAGYETAFDYIQSEALSEDETRILIQSKAMLWRR